MFQIQYTDTSPSSTFKLLWAGGRWDQGVEWHVRCSAYIEGEVHQNSHTLPLVVGSIFLYRCVRHGTYDWATNFVVNLVSRMFSIISIVKFKLFKFFPGKRFLGHQRWLISSKLSFVMFEIVSLVKHSFHFIIFMKNASKFFNVLFFEVTLGLVYTFNVRWLPCVSFILCFQSDIVWSEMRGLVIFLGCVRPNSQWPLEALPSLEN